jgi:predicted transcriptional regulator
MQLKVINYKYVKNYSLSMKRTFCEYMIWNGFPVIRKKIVESMINDFGLSQREAAEKLGISPAAVCQYVLKKRAKIDITDDHLLNEIRQSAESIITNGNGYIIPETCRICKIIRDNGTSPLFSCDNEYPGKVCCCGLE